MRITLQPQALHGYGEHKVCSENIGSTPECTDVFGHFRPIDSYSEIAPPVFRNDYIWIILHLVQYLVSGQRYWHPMLKLNTRISPEKYILCHVWAQMSCSFAKGNNYNA